MKAKEGKKESQPKEVKPFINLGAWTMLNFVRKIKGDRSA